MNWLRRGRPETVAPMFSPASDTLLDELRGRCISLSVRLARARRLAESDTPYEADVENTILTVLPYLFNIRPIGADTAASLAVMLSSAELLISFMEAGK